jgi:hypothetical protein
MIQIFSKKKTLFFLFFFNSLFFSHKILAQSSFFIADSLFEQKQYLQAAQTYYRLIQENEVASTQALLKLAWCGEVSGIYPYTLFALLHLRQIQYPKADQKLAQLTKVHNLSGYQYSDNQFFIFFLKKNWLLIALVYGLGALVLLFLAFWQKKFNRSLNGVVGVGLFWTLLFGLVLNFAPKPNYAICLEPRVLLMESPSHASKVAHELKMGERVKVKSQLGYWTAVETENQTLYVKTSLLLSSI